MPIVLFRVDERLIHGQVVLGWGRVLDPDRYVLVDDELAASDWEQDLYRLGAGDAEVRFLTVPEGREALGELKADPERTVVLTRDVAHMAALAARGGLAGEEVNLGGIHHRAGRDEVLPYLHLDDRDRAAIRELLDAGARVSARDLPDTGRVSGEALLR